LEKRTNNLSNCKRRERTICVGADTTFCVLPVRQWRDGKERECNAVYILNEMLEFQRE
jgi:hypothetical protein